MGQREVIQALKNLGNRALRDELIEEYFRIHYPDPIQREQFTKTTYKIGNTISPYLTKLRRNGMLDSIFVKHPNRKYSIEYFLVNSEPTK